MDDNDLKLLTLRKRVDELAQELGVSADRLIWAIQQLGVFVEEETH